MATQQGEFVSPQTSARMNPKVFWSLIAILAALQGWFWLRAGHI